MKSILLIFILICASIFSTITFSASHEIKNILLIVAMEEEAAPIIKLLHLSPVSLDPRLPMKAYAGNYSNIKVE